MTALDVRSVSKLWTPDAGLREVSLTVDAGELVVVRGRSGSGKSTLLSIVAGWCRPDRGEVLVRGEPLPTTPSWHLVSAVPQVFALAAELTLAEALADAAGTTEGNDALLTVLDLHELAHRRPAQMSMGQQQRAAVARALIGRPAVVLADEPTSHQDIGHVAMVVDALREAAMTGAAVVVASHDDTVAAAATRVVDLATDTP